MVIMKGSVRPSITCKGVQFCNVFNTVDHQGHMNPPEMYHSVLQSCIRKKDIIQGRNLLSLLTCNGLASHPSFGAILISMFGTCGNLQEAQWLFCRLPHPNLFSWTAIILAYARLGHGEQAIDIYHQMDHLKPDEHLFVSILKACMVGEYLMEGMLFHGHIIEDGLEHHTVVGNSVIEMYVKYGMLEEACNVFSSLPNPSVVTWSIVIVGLVEQRQSREAIWHFWQMEFEPDSVVFGNALKACSSLPSPDDGRLIHAKIIEGCHEKSLPINNSLVEMYANSGSLEDAQGVFIRAPERGIMAWHALISGNLQQRGRDEDAVCLLRQMEWNNIQPTKLTWNLVISGLVQQDKADKAFQLFLEMLNRGIKPDSGVHISTLKGCTNIKLAWIVHAHIVETYREMDSTIRNTLIDTYARCKSSHDACSIFNSSWKKNVVTWTVMINCHLLERNYDEAFLLFEHMHESGVKPNHVTFLSMLKGCSTDGCIKKGGAIHNYIVRSHFEMDELICNSLIAMYTRCGLLDDAYCVFKGMLQKSVVTWTAMIAGYSQNGCVLEASTLFQQMHEDGVQPNNITWNAMVAGFAEQGHSEEAIEVFQHMQKKGHQPDDVTFIGLLKACGNLALLSQGEAIHSLIIEDGYDGDVFVMNTLIDMYAKCGSIAHSRRAFDISPKQDIVTLNAMITGYSYYEEDEKALSLLEKLEQDGISPDHTTFLSVLSSCSNMLALSEGKLVHCLMVENNLISDKLSCNALIDMYAKCGSLNDAYSVFETTVHRDVITWSTMAAGYTQQNKFASVVEAFEQMKREGLEPDDVTFLGLLSTCAQMGFLDEGCWLFSSMTEIYGLTPKISHFNCLATLIANAGCWNEVDDLLQTMPFHPDIIGWTSLLSRCRSHGNVEKGERFFKQVLATDHRDAASIQLMSNIYSEACMRRNGNEIGELRQFVNSWKKPGKAFIEVNEMAHAFVVGDTTHGQSDLIFSKLHSLAIKMKSEGYTPYDNQM